MKARYTTQNGQITFEVDGENAKALFSQIASIQEVFDAEHACGMCNSTDIRYLARKVDDFDFYELACQSCRARFAFGQAKKGGALFPKRKDEDGNWIPNKGWTKFEPQSISPPVPPVPNVSRPLNPPPISDALQKCFDRLGELLHKPAPTRLSAALDLLREAMHTEAGPSGTAKFDDMYRTFEFRHKGTADTKVIKEFLAQLVAAWQDLGVTQ